jgi:hypothetical protein
MKSFIRLIFACSSIFFVGCGEWSCPEEKYGIGQCPGSGAVELRVSTTYWEQLMDVGLEIKDAEIPDTAPTFAARRCGELSELAEKIAPTYGLSPSWLMGIIKNESSCGVNTTPRREPGSIHYAIRAVGSRHEKYWSSWGVGQVMGYRAKAEYGVEPEELEDDELSMEVIAAAFKKCLDEQEGSRAQKLFKASACYNGGRGWQRASGENRDKILKYGLRFLEHINVGA